MDPALDTSPSRAAARRSRTAQPDPREPEFALYLSCDGIELFHRAGGTWSHVGLVPVDAKDLGQELARLRQRGAALSPHPMTTKVVMPDSQIVYTEVAVAGPESRRRQEIRSALEARAPSSTDEFAFDWCEAGDGKVRVAVIARGILAEAESFVRDHHFNPVVIVGAAQDGQFPREPWFGGTARKPLQPRAGDAPATRVAAVEPTADAAATAADAATPVTSTAAITPAETKLARSEGPNTETTGTPAHPSDAAAASSTTADASLGDAPAAAAAPALDEPTHPSANTPAGSEVAAPEPTAPTESPAPDSAAATNVTSPAPSGEALASGADAPAEEAAQDERQLGATAGAPQRTDTEPDPGEPEAQPAAPPAPAPDRSATVLQFATHRRADPSSAADPPVAPRSADRQRYSEPRLSLAATGDAASAMAPAARDAQADLGTNDPAPATSTADAAATRDSAAEVTPEGSAAGHDVTSSPAEQAGTAEPAPESSPASAQVDATTTATPALQDATALGSRAASRLTSNPNMPPRLLRALSVIKGGATAQSLRDEPPAPATGVGPLAVTPQDGTDRPQRMPPMPARLRKALPAAAPAARLPRLAALPAADKAVGAGASPAARLGPPSLAARSAAARPIPLRPLVGVLVFALVLAAIASWVAITRNPSPPAQVAATGAASEDNAETTPAAGDTADVAAFDEAAFDEADYAAATPTAADRNGEVDGAEATADTTTASAEPDPEELADLAAIGDEQPAAATAETTPAAPGAAPTLAAAADVAGAAAQTAPDAGEALDRAEADTASGPQTPALPDDPVTELVPTDQGAAARVAEQLAAQLTPEVAQKTYGESGVWVLPPDVPPEPDGATADDVRVAAVDPDLTTQDAIGLEPMDDDKALAPQQPPPPFGARFDLDANGLVRATPEGALTPDGLMVTAGRPAQVPPPRPTSAAAAATPTPADQPASADAGADALPMANPPPPKVRPHWRPGDLSERAEKAALGGRTRSELAAFRPRARPDSVTIAAAAAASVTPDGPGPAGAAVADQAEAIAGQVVAVSRVPQRRPAAVVRAAAAARQPAPPPAGKAAAAAPPPADNVAPEADDEGEAVAAMPPLPTRANVAKTATIPNALKIGKVNLIGVYGTPKQRRALVMLNGNKYVKVQVGDRLDGGRVAAIGDTQLVYVKGGKQIRLDMPSKS